MKQLHRVSLACHAKTELEAAIHSSLYH